MLYSAQVRIWSDGRHVTKIVFSSDLLPTELDERQRYALWRDLYQSTYTAFDFSRLPNQPFSARFEFMQFGAVGLAQFTATIDGVTRNRAHIAKHPRDYLCLAMLGPRCRIVQRQHGREAEHDPGAVLLTNEAEAATFSIPDGSDWVLLDIPRESLRQRVVNVEDLVATQISSNPQALAHLRNYAGMLLKDADGPNNPELTDIIGRSLLDLAALVLGGGRNADGAPARGLRAARLRDIVAVIQTRFCDPAFSTDDVAKVLGLSRRYINELLFESELGFSERVLELRLQKASAMLADPRNDRSKVSDIAFTCGFSDVSYFNRRFRARFGCSPTQYRGGGS